MLKILNDVAQNDFYAAFDFFDINHLPYSSRRAAKYSLLNSLSRG